MEASGRPGKHSIPAHPKPLSGGSIHVTGTQDTARRPEIPHHQPGFPPARGRDQREAMASLDAAGKAALATAVPLWAEAQSRIETSLGADAGERLHALLQAL